MSRNRRPVIIAAATLLVMLLVVPAASAVPSEDTLATARAAVTIGQEKAKGHSAEAPGQQNRARGLERAEAAIAAAAERKAARDATGAEGEKPGRGLGRGHAAEVHAILLAGGSPSKLPSHGERVSGLAQAFDKVKADHPGRGQGPTNKGGDDGDGEDE
jgi:hypothetical protein